MSYCVKQNIVDWNGNVVQSDIARDGFYTLEGAEQSAKELAKRNADDFGDLNLNSGYKYVFVAEEE